MEQLKHPRAKHGSVLETRKLGNVFDAGSWQCRRTGTRSGTCGNPHDGKSCSRLMMMMMMMYGQYQSIGSMTDVADVSADVLGASCPFSDSGQCVEV